MVMPMKTSEIVDHYYTPGIGAGTYAVKGVKAEIDKVLQDANVPDPPDFLATKADETLVAFDDARGRIYDWDLRKRAEPLARKGAVEADNRVDRAVSRIYETAKGYLDFDEGTTEHQMAKELIAGCFPEGVYPITSDRFEEEHDKVNELMSRLRGPFAGHITHLRMGLFVDHLDGVNSHYGEALGSKVVQGVTHEDVEAAEEAAVESYFELILCIWVATMNNLELREKLMAPIEEQNERLARYYKERMRVPKFDPDTGEPVDEDTDEPVVDPVEPVE